MQRWWWLSLSNCGSGCKAPVTLFVLVVLTTAFTVFVCCGNSVWCPSANIWRVSGLQFFISSVKTNVISTCGKLIVPFAVSITAWWFRMKFSPVIGKDVFERMTKVSVNVYFPILNRISSVAIGCSNWAFALSILKGGWGIPWWRNFRYSFWLCCNQTMTMHWWTLLNQPVRPLLFHRIRVANITSVVVFWVLWLSLVVVRVSILSSYVFVDWVEWDGEVVWEDRFLGGAMSIVLGRLWRWLFVMDLCILIYRLCNGMFFESEGGLAVEIWLVPGIASLVFIKYIYTFLVWLWDWSFGGHVLIVGIFDPVWVFFSLVIFGVVLFYGSNFWSSQPVFRLFSFLFCCGVVVVFDGGSSIEYALASTAFPKRRIWASVVFERVACLVVCSATVFPGLLPLVSFHFSAEFVAIKAIPFLVSWKVFSTGFDLVFGWTGSTMFNETRVTSF